MKLIGILVIFAAALLPVIGIVTERKAYNNGKCPKCGLKLRNFDTDSQGGRGYMCDNCGYGTWVSYNCVDRREEECPKD